jgi:3-(3-hydroxy-phenyl)propionate hydroxylase
MQAVTYDVAIVGFGPVGAVAAGLLGQRGLSVYVCERTRDVYELPRALSLDHEVMRVFQQLGVVEQVAPFCEPFTPSEYYGVDGHLIRRMTMLPPPFPQGHTPSLVFTQPAVERVLRAAIAQLPSVDVALGCELNALDQDDNGVTLTVSSQRVRARWVIACDGGSSTVRSLLGATVEDLDFDEPWLVVDVRVNAHGLAKLPRVSAQYCQPARPCSYLIAPGDHRRWEIALAPGEDPRQMATPKRTWQLLSRWLKPRDGVLWRQTAYRFHALVAQHWRHGRVFLAGDAAHMQPPFLGQGLCQGIRDVANLAWKLAAVIRGRRSPGLLDSYSVERKAHVCELTRRIKDVGALICERDLHAARERDARLLAECSGVVRDTPRQELMPRLEQGLLAPQAHAARGALFPQPRLSNGHDATVLMDARFGYGWRLFSDGRLQPMAAEPQLVQAALGRGDLCETQGVLAAWFARHQCRAALVRPDHYVFGVAGSQAELHALLAQWRAALA